MPKWRSRFAQQLQNLYELLEQLQQDELLQLWQETLHQFIAVGTDARLFAWLLCAFSTRTALD